MPRAAPPRPRRNTDARQRRADEPGPDKADNIAQARALIEGAVAADQPDLVSLPEIWTCLGGDRAAKFGQAEDLPPPGSDEPGGAAYEFLRGIARARRTSMCTAARSASRGRRKLFNTTVVFDPEGRELARYRKIHLFDIVTPDGTGYRESNIYGAGDEVVTYQAGDVRVGCAICYDVRFPELFLALRRAGRRADLPARRLYRCRPARTIGRR